MEKGRKSNTPYALSLPLPHHTSDGWPLTCVLVMFKKVQRYPATSM
jgi:hypothetical protein